MTLGPMCHNAFKLWCKQPVGQLLKMSSEDLPGDTIGRVDWTEDWYDDWR